MSVDEFLHWCEWDKQHLEDSWYQHSALMCQIAILAGSKRVDPAQYHPPVKRSRRRKTLGEFVGMLRAVATRIVDPKGEANGQG